MASCWRKTKHFFGQITVEPMIFLFSAAHGFYVLVAQSLYIAKVCSVNLNYTREICDDIYHHPEAQIETQKYVSTLQAYNLVLQSVPAIVYTLFAGPWSDIYGRRAMIIWSCAGYVINNGVYIINTIWWDELKAEYLLFECLQDCTGGYHCFFLGCYSYMADITTREKRTKRIAFMDGLFPIGFFVGMSLSGVVKEKIGFVANFGFGMGGALLTMVWAIFLLKDSRNMRPKEVQAELDRKAAEEGEVEKKNMCLALFDINNLKLSFKTAFKKRPHGLRPFLLLAMFAFILEIFFNYGKMTTFFLFMRKEFKWTESTFGQYMAVFGIVGLFTQYCAIPFLKETIKLHDTTIGILGCVGAVIQYVITAFTHKDWMIYIAGLLAFLSPCITTVCRSMVSKDVGPLEVGAVFSVLGAFQAAVPLISAPMYAATYKATIETFPGAFLMVAAGGAVLIAICFTATHFGMKKVERTLEKHKEEEEKAEKEKLTNGDNVPKVLKGDDF